jgi:hypothetical protein
MIYLGPKHPKNLGHIEISHFLPPLGPRPSKLVSNVELKKKKRAPGSHSSQYNCFKYSHKDYQEDQRGGREQSLNNRGYFSNKKETTI